MTTTNTNPKVLVITDTQIDFITGVLGNADCEAVIPVIVNLIETGDYDIVVLTKDTHDGNYLNTQEGRKLPIPHTIKGTKGWQIVPEIIQALKNKYKDDYDKKVYVIEKTSIWRRKHHVLHQKNIHKLQR